MIGFDRPLTYLDTLISSFRSLGLVFNMESDFIMNFQQAIKFILIDIMYQYQRSIMYFVYLLFAPLELNIQMNG